MKAGLVEVTKRNVPQIEACLKKTKGKLLIYEPELSINDDLMGDAQFSLFGNAQIRDGNCISIDKVNHLDSREYSLKRRVPSENVEWERAYSFFDILKLDSGYTFKIHGSFVMRRGLFANKGKTIYIPRNKGLELEELALRYAIGIFIEQIGKSRERNKNGLCERELELMVMYAMQDLRDRKILTHNIRAGQEADAFLGM